MNCGNYRDIKPMCHSMKLYERVHNNRLKNIVSISEEQFGFMNGKYTTDAIFCAKTPERKIQRRISRLSQVLCSLIWKKHTTESQGKSCIGERETRGYQRSTSDW